MCWVYFSFLLLHFHFAKCVRIALNLREIFHTDKTHIAHSASSDNNELAHCCYWCDRHRSFSQCYHLTFQTDRQPNYAQFGPNSVPKMPHSTLLHFRCIQTVNLTCVHSLFSSLKLHAVFIHSDVFWYFTSFLLLIRSILIIRISTVAVCVFFLSLHNTKYSFTIRNRIAFIISIEWSI